MGRYNLKEVKRLLGQASASSRIDLGALKNAVNNIEMKLSTIERGIPIDLFHAIDEIDQEYIELNNKIDLLTKENGILNEKIANFLGTDEGNISTSEGKIIVGISDLEKKNEEAVFDALSAFNKQCPYCGKDQYRVGLRDKIEIDHFIPVSRGGQNLPWNLLPVCKECNRRKKDRLPFQFLEAAVFERCQNYLSDVRRRHYEEGIQQLENSRRLIDLVKEHQRFFEINAREPFIQELLQLVQPEKLIELSEFIGMQNFENSYGASPVDIMKFLTDYISNRKGQFSTGIVASPFNRVCDNLQDEAPAGIGRITPQLLLRVLKKLQWKDMGRINSKEFTTKKHTFCAPDLGYISKSELRRMSEARVL
jgi:hypothetical protein